VTVRGICATRPVVNEPFGLALSADGRRLFVAQGGNTATLSVFDTATMQASSLYTGAGSYGVQLNSAETRAYVSNSGAGTVSVVDVSSTLEVIGTINGFLSPGSLRLSADGAHLYALETGSSPVIAIAGDLNRAATP